MTTNARPDVERAPTASDCSSSGWQLISQLSHTFRTPLNHVLGFAEILDSQSFGPLNDRQRNYVGKIQAAGRRQLKLLDQLVDISRVHTSELDMTVREWDLNAFLNDVVKASHAQAAADNVELVSVSDTDFRLRGDFDHFHQILDSLLAYMIKRSPAGETVTIHIAPCEELGCNPWISDVEGPVWLDISITDAGGPPAAAEQQLLNGETPEPQQLDDVTGLGLVYARTLVDKLGGSLSHDTGQHDGITINLKIPFIQLAPVSSERFDT